MLENSSDKPLPVRVISEAIGDYISRLGPVWIEGELSEVKVRPGSSMVYMRLRDTSADMSLSIMCHKSTFAAAGELSENARVIINAKASWYSKNGSLSMSFKEIRQVGLGELLARLEALKNTLASEGLFAASRKRELPFLPKVVGLICGRNSDAEKDVIENAKRRWPSVQFAIREVAVQGSAAVVEVSNALRELDSNPDVDVIIITRGGGSFEDLLPFSDESLIRLVAESTTPIVSAIGHEKDSPLLDLVADWRASTPTDAGKRVVPDVDEEFRKIAQLQDRALRTLTHRIERERSWLTAILSRPTMADPMSMVSDRQEELDSLISHLTALSPQGTLDRGYAVVLKSDGTLVMDASAVASDEKIAIRVAHGTIAATVNGALQGE
jgi:exodeoxyribonuclease VII large subunit